MVEMHDMIVHVQRQLHDVADAVGVFGNGDAERILHRPHRGQRVRAGAHAADALGEGPGVARVAALQDQLDAAPHRAGGDRVADDVIGVNVHLHAQMALDAGDRVYHDAAAGSIEAETVRRIDVHGGFSLSASWSGG